MTIPMNQNDKPFWTLSPEDAFNQFGTSLKGLAPDEAQKRLLRFGANLLKPKQTAEIVSAHNLESGNT